MKTRMFIMLIFTILYNAMWVYLINFDCTDLFVGILAMIILFILNIAAGIWVGQRLIFL